MSTQPPAPEDGRLTFDSPEVQYAYDLLKNGYSLGSINCNLLADALKNEHDARVATERERDDEKLRANCLANDVSRWKKWREEQPWVAEINSYVTQLGDMVKQLAAANKRIEDQRVSILELIGERKRAERLAEESEARAQHESKLRATIEANVAGQAERIVKAEAEIARLRTALGRAGESL